LHLLFDVVAWCLHSLHLTDVKTGETLLNFPFAPGTVVLADRGYSHRGGVAHVLASGGDVVVRCQVQQFPLADRQGQALDVAAALHDCESEETRTLAVQFTAPDGTTYPVFLHAYRLAAGAAAAARRRCRQAAKKGHRTPKDVTLWRAEFVLVLTSLAPAVLAAALDGELSAHQQWLVGRLLQQIASVERELARYSARLRTQRRAYETQLERLDTISGVGRRVAENRLAEIGPEMTPFATDEQLVRWAALCPGKEQSGNKRGKTRTAKGNRWLKRVLTEAAWAATHERQGYMAALYRRIAPRRGKKHPDHRGGAHDLTSGLAHFERRCGVPGIGRGLL
jgi:hypothetical protein